MAEIAWFVSNTVRLHLRLKIPGQHVGQQFAAFLDVDEHGMVGVYVGSLDPTSHEAQEKGREVRDVLIEELGVCEWRAIGPEDSEAFLTDEWMERLSPYLHGSSGWHTVDADWIEAVEA